MGPELSWCLQAVGKTALPFLLPMYDYPELGPRMAALEAGAKLGDHRSVAPLIELARNAPASLRVEAIGLLADMPANPNINVAMRELVNAPELEVRVGALLRRANLAPDALLAPPAADAPGSCSYCPRCRDQFVSGVQRCPHGVELCPVRRS